MNPTREVVEDTIIKNCLTAGILKPEEEDMLRAALPKFTYDEVLAYLVVTHQLAEERKLKWYYVNPNNICPS